jgi:hypothetical protein
MKISMPKNLQGQVKDTQSGMYIIVGLATVVTIFCLFSAKSLLSQGAYQRDVINQRNKAVKQLNDNIKNADQLKSQFTNVFENTGPANMIGGKNDNSPNAVPPDGDNARIVLDALPSSYDFPALVTSLAKILTTDNIGNPSIGGSDSSTSISNKPSATPQTTSIDVPISGSTNYAGLQKLMADLMRSIRPYDITSLQVSGSEAQMNFNLKMNTYFQPPKSLDVTWQTVTGKKQ